MEHLSVRDSFSWGQLHLKDNGNVSVYLVYVQYLVLSKSMYISLFYRCVVLWSYVVVYYHFVVV